MCLSLQPRTYQQGKTMTAQKQKKMRYRYQMPYNETRIHTYYAKANVILYKMTSATKACLLQSVTSVVANS